MADTDKKKKRPIVLFLLAFIVVVILMFVANYKSIHVQELSGPKSGVEKLSTCGERLIAISKDKDIYTWNWNDLSARPQVGSVKAQQAAAMSPDRLIWVPSGENNVVVVSNLRGDKELKRLSLGVNERCILLQASPNGKYAVAALAIGGGSDKRIQLSVIDSDVTYIRPVGTKTMEDGLKLNNIGISNDGAFVSAVGGKDSGWILVADARSRKILWEQTVSDTDELNNVVFSQDGQMVYASEPGRFVYSFEAATGKPAKKFEMDKYKTPPNNPQTISCIVVSPDGSLLAASTVPASQVLLWDAQSGKRLAVIHPGQFTVNSLAFSPDSSLLATGDLIGIVPMKIWRLSDVF